jgi:hypothetical protein
VVAISVAVAVGLVVLNTVGGSDKYQAQSVVFLGQPLSPGGGQTLPTTVLSNPASASQFVRSDPVINKAAGAAGLKANALRANTSVTAPTATTKASPTAANITITIRGPKAWKKDQIKTAITSLSNQLIDWANTYQDAKAKLLGDQISTDQEELGVLRASVDKAQGELDRLDRSSMGAADRAAASSTLLATIANAGSRIDEIASQMTQNQLYLEASKTVEAAGFVQQPSIRTVTATSKHSSLIVAAFAGLIVGVVLALLWDLIRRPREAR